MTCYKTRDSPPSRARRFRQFLTILRNSTTERALHYFERSINRFSSSSTTTSIDHIITMPPKKAATATKAAPKAAPAHSSYQGIFSHVPVAMFVAATQDSSYRVRRSLTRISNRHDQGGCHLGTLTAPGANGLGCDRDRQIATCCTFDRILTAMNDGIM